MQAILIKLDLIKSLTQIKVDLIVFNWYGSKEQEIITALLFYLTVFLN